MSVVRDTLVIAPNSMILALSCIVQGRCMIVYPGHALQGHKFSEIYAFGGDWVDRPEMHDWLENIRCRFDAPGKQIRWIK